MRQYRWKGFSFKGDATVVGHELETIEVGGELTNKEVLSYAEKHQDSELHKCFDWDDEVAGNKWRLSQASTILSAITIVTSEKTDTTPEETVKAYVVIQNKDNEQKLKNISLVLQDDEEYTQLKKRAYKDLERCKDKYAKLIQLNDLKEVVFDLYKNI